MVAKEDLAGSWLINWSRLAPTTVALPIAAAIRCATITSTPGPPPHDQSRWAVRLGLPAQGSQRVDGGCRRPQIAPGCRQAPGGATAAGGFAAAGAAVCSTSAP